MQFPMLGTPVVFLARSSDFVFGEMISAFPEPECGHGAAHVQLSPCGVGYLRRGPSGRIRGPVASGGGWVARLRP